MPVPLPIPFVQFLLSGRDFLCKFFLGAYLNSLGRAWAEGRGELATCRHRADSRREMTKCTPRHSLDGLDAGMIEQKKKAAVVCMQLASRARTPLGSRTRRYPRSSAYKCPPRAHTDAPSPTMARLRLLLAVLLAAVVIAVSASPNPQTESKAALCCRKRPSLPRSFSLRHLCRD